MVVRWSWLGLCCLLLQACATPAGKLDSLAREQGFERSTIEAGGFKLLVYRNSASVEALANRPADAASSTLHVYLEGDGTPWLHRTIIMSDPTPRQPLMLRLMSLDRQPAAYLGRPCYNGTAADPLCENTLWTSGRYSKAVIDSMASGIRVLARRHHASQIWLLGHSGGGALAMLLAGQVPQVSRVITVAGNLDTDAWTRHHGYTPLFSSINPADSPPLRSEVLQWHLLGGKDTVIPPQLVRPFIMRQSRANGFLVERFSHGCCWLAIWPEVLDAVTRDDPQRVPAQQFKFPIGGQVVEDSQ